MGDIIQEIADAIHGLEKNNKKCIKILCNFQDFHEIQLQCYNSYSRQASYIPGVLSTPLRQEQQLLTIFGIEIMMIRELKDCVLMDEFGQTSRVFKNRRFMHDFPEFNVDFEKSKNKKHKFNFIKETR